MTWNRYSLDMLQWLRESGQVVAADDLKFWQLRRAIKVLDAWGIPLSLLTVTLLLRGAEVYFGEYYHLRIFNDSLYLYRLSEGAPWNWEDCYLDLVAVEYYTVDSWMPEPENLPWERTFRVD